MKFDVFKKDKKIGTILHNGKIQNAEYNLMEIITEIKEQHYFNDPTQFIKDNNLETSIGFKPIIHATKYNLDYSVSRSIMNGKKEPTNSKYATTLEDIINGNFIVTRNTPKQRAAKPKR